MAIRMSISPSSEAAWPPSLRTDHPDRPEGSEIERLYAVCLPVSAYPLKLLLKQASLYAPNQPLLSSRDALPSPCPLPSAVRIPLTITQARTDGNGSGALLPSDDPSIGIPPSLASAASGHLLGFQWLRAPATSARLKYLPASPLRRAIELFFGADSVADLVKQLPTWEAYDDLVLFQPNAFLAPVWGSALPSERVRAAFFATVATEFGVSHLARKGLIDRTDVSRKPQLVPIHGVFRRNLGPDGRPRTFEDAFWTATRFSTPQGSIEYIWAPSETMYSRGNSVEKLRIAALGNVKDTVVVDMCCGIGFFAFAYLAAGAARVIGCELSAWAVEGLRRGAIANGITYELVGQAFGERDALATPARLLIAACPNALALPIYRHTASHVNLGLLPSSVEFLPQAVEALRPAGGWLHVHGELAVGGGPEGRRRGAETWAAELVEQVRALGQRSAELVGIHWIKSIGPAKDHLVVELHVGPALPVPTTSSDAHSEEPIPLAV